MRLALRLVLVIVIIIMLYNTQEQPNIDTRYEQPSVIIVEELPPIRAENE